MYPNASFVSSTGAARGVVRSGTGSPVYGAHVVIVDSADRPIASTISDPSGTYQVSGLAPGSYSAYAEALDGPLNPTEVPSLARTNPGPGRGSRFHDSIHRVLPNNHCGRDNHPQATTNKG